MKGLDDRWRKYRAEVRKPIRRRHLLIFVISMYPGFVLIEFAFGSGPAEAFALSSDSRSFLAVIVVATGVEILYHRIRYGKD